MFYVLSWSGRGIIVLPLLFIPAVLMFALDSLGSQAALDGFFAGWLISGIICWVLGRRWNAGEPRHRFAKLRMETWGIILTAFGSLLLVRLIVLAIEHLRR